MKKIAMGIVVGLLFMGIVSTASAQLAQFAGKWVNTNSNTGGVTKLEISISGTNVMVHAWGKCHPTDCDWKNVQGFAYGQDVSSNLQATAQAITVIYKESFAETLLTIRHVRWFLFWKRLRAQVYTRFTDTNGRTNFVDVETFRKH